MHKRKKQTDNSHSLDVPTDCVRCKTPNSAEGYYVSGPYKGKTGICKRHKAHGGAKIVWRSKDETNKGN